MSALLDDEPIADRDGTIAHLAECIGCEQWRAAAQRLQSTSRLAFAAVPDLTVPILEAAAEQQTKARLAERRKHQRRSLALQVAVGVSAVTQFVLALPALLVASGISGLVDTHSSHEMASFDIAIAIGFLVAALRPERAKALVPIAVVLAACLAATASVDVATGTTGVMHEAAHLTTLVQAGLLWALGRSHAKASLPRSSELIAS